MKIQIETQDIVIPTHSLPTLRKRVLRAMAQVSEHVNCLHLSLRDINGAKGGRDKVCTVRATLMQGGEVLVVDRSARLPKAIFRGLRRSKHLIRRELKRRRQLPRGRLANRRLIQQPA